MVEFDALHPPTRLLLGPGPSNVASRVTKALSAPIVGHFDPYFLGVMDEIRDLLRCVFRTKNELTLPIPGTGTAGMEAALCNVIEAGDEVVVGVNGFFGERMCQLIARLGGQPVRVEAQWGKAIGEEAVDEALKHSDATIVALVHAETSTGVLQPLKEIGNVARSYDALFLVDAVTSLGGCELDVDESGIDICYSGTQKCLACPPGLAPFTANDVALERMANRTSAVTSYYLDVRELDRYWSEERVYHHTAPIPLLYALREALRMVQEEGLEGRWRRHVRNRDALVHGLAAMELNLFADQRYRLPSLTTVTIPQGVGDAAVRGTLLRDFNVEIGGGLGLLKGVVWRLGLMGVNSDEKVVLALLEALERALHKEGHPLTPGAGVKAATAFYGNQGARSGP